MSMDKQELINKVLAHIKEDSKEFQDTINDVKSFVGENKIKKIIDGDTVMRFLGVLIKRMESWVVDDVALRQELNSEFSGGATPGSTGRGDKKLLISVAESVAPGARKSGELVSFKRIIPLLSKVMTRDEMALAAIGLASDGMIYLHSDSGTPASESERAGMLIGPTGTRYVGLVIR